MDELLKLLKRNALESPGNLARMLNMTEDEVRARIAEYERAGVIRAYQAVVNTDRLDVDLVRAVIEIKVTPERDGGFNRIARRVSKFPEVESLHLMSGAYDLMVVVQGKTMREVAYFVAERLAPLDTVLSTATHFVLKRYKVDGDVLEERTEEKRLPVTP